MALSGSLGNTFRSGWRLQLEWSATQSLTNNTSTITSRLYLVSQKSWATIRSSSSNGYRVNVNGEVYTGTFNPSLSGNQKKLISTDTTTVAHNSDGRKSFSLGAYADLKVTLSGRYYGRVTIPNRTFTLDTIPRYSTLSGNLNWTIGDSLPLTINRAASSFTSRVLIKVNGTTRYDESDVSDNFVWNPSNATLDSIYESIPNDSKTELFVRLYTYSGSTMIGFNDYTGTANVVDARPTFSNFTYRDLTNSSITGNNQVLIQDHSQVRVEVPSTTRARAIKGASMVRYQISFGNKSVNMDYSSATINTNIGTTSAKGTVPLSVTAVDSRGLRRTITKNVQVLEYKVPLLQSTVERLNGFEETTEIDLKGTYSPLKVGGTSKNNIYSLQYRIYEVGTSAPGYTTAYEVTYSKDKFEVPTFTKPLDINKTYRVDIRVQDRITGWEYESLTTRVGVPPWMFEGDGNFRYKGGLIQTGNEKTIANNGLSTERFEGATGTDAGLRALKMGDNYTAVGETTRFPSRAGAWVYFQNAPVGGAGGSEHNADFFLWKDRRQSSKELYVGHLDTNGSVMTDGVNRIVTVIDEGTYSRNGTTGSYIKYSDGRLIVYWEREFTSSNFRGSNDVLWNWITPNIYFMQTAFSSPPVITSNASAGEIMGFANRQTFNNYFNLRLFATSNLTMAITISGVAEGRWD